MHWKKKPSKSIVLCKRVFWKYTNSNIFISSVDIIVSWYSLLISFIDCTIVSEMSLSKVNRTYLQKAFKEQSEYTYGNNILISFSIINFSLLVTLFFRYCFTKHSIILQLNAQAVSKCNLKKNMYSINMTVLEHTVQNTIICLNKIPS